MTTAASGLLLIQTRLEYPFCQNTLTARGKLNAPFRLPLYFVASNFSNMPQHFPEHKVGTQTEPPPPTISRCRQILLNSVLIETFKKRKSKSLPTNTTILDSDETIGAVHYKTCIDWATQMERKPTYKTRT